MYTKICPSRREVISLYDLSREMVIAIMKDYQLPRKFPSENVNEAYGIMRAQLSNSFNSRLEELNQQSQTARFLLEGLRMDPESTSYEMAVNIIRDLKEEYGISEQEYLLKQKGEL